MSTAEETVTVNPDGSTTFEGESADTPPVEDPMNGEEGAGGGDFTGEETMGEDMVSKGTDPAIYLLFLAILLAILYYLYIRKSRQDQEDDFFSNLDGEKFNLELPTEVEEYYEVKKKMLSAGWKPGEVPDKANANSKHRVMAQALMKRSIADIPLVTHIQKESAGMNKLYSQSMCSVKQWKAYQAAEAMVSAEVDEVRAEADEIEPGWSQVIWRQAMQYHNMLKQKHEAEQKAAAEQAAKRKVIESKVSAEQKKINDAKEKELAAERAAQELIKAEEREKNSKKAFGKGGAMKKGFLDKGKKK